MNLTPYDAGRPWRDSSGSARPGVVAKQIPEEADLRAPWPAALSRRATREAHQGVGPELVGHALPDPVALDEVAGLDIIGQDHDLIADRAARRLDLADRPDPVALARPEREPGAVRAVEGLSASDPRRDLDLAPSARAPGRRHLLPPGHASPRRRSSLPRSKPTTTSPSMTVTGVA